LDFVGDASLTPEDKAEHLARLARASLTAESWRTGRDGISYLANVMAAGVETPLTRLYAEAVLRLAPGAQSLADVRNALARQHDWTDCVHAEASLTPD
jgi:hypothetical protein